MPENEKPNESEEKSKQSEEKPRQPDEKEVEDNGKKVSRSKYDKAVEEAEKAKADAEHWKNEYYKAYADTTNLRKSLEEDRNTAVRYRAEGFLESLLPALDSFHVALDVPAPTAEARNYQIGFTYIYNQIVASLTNEGVSEICPKIGDDYDPKTMHAVDKIETNDVAEGKVAKVGTKGYRLHDRLVRAAMVYVATPIKKEEVSETNSEEKETKHEA